MNTLIAQQATVGDDGQEQGTLFDRLKHVRLDGTEYWSARELQPHVGYGQCRRWADAIERAKISASNSGIDVQRNFARGGKVSGTRGPAQQDYELSRFAVYLALQNGDPRKREIAAAQAYFAVRTREAETARPVSIESIIEDPDFAIQALTALRDERQLRKQAEASRDAAVAQIEADAPATGLGRALDDAGALSLKDAAAAVQQRMRDAGHDGFSIGQNRLAQRLIDLKMVYRRGQNIVPYQRAAEAGWLRAVSKSYATPNGERVRWTVRVTAKGVDHLVKRLAPAGGGAGE